MSKSQQNQRFRGRSCAVAFAAMLATATAAGADIIKKDDMLRGITMTRGQCDAIKDTVWVNVFGRDFCVRYYLSTAGGEGTRPVVFMQGDYFGNIKNGTWVNTSDAKDINTDDLMGTADGFSKMTKTTAIYLARIGWPESERRAVLLPRDWFLLEDSSRKRVHDALAQAGFVVLAGPVWMAGIDQVIRRRRTLSQSVRQ